MKTRCRLCAPSGIHRDSIMQLRTAMLAQMPTLTSRMAITCTIQQRRAGTTQQVSAHQTSRSSTMPYPAPWPKLRVGEPKSQELVIFPKRFVSFVSLVSLVSLVSVVSLGKLVQHQGRYAGNAAHCRKGLLILH